MYLNSVCDETCMHTCPHQMLQPPDVVKTLYSPMQTLWQKETNVHIMQRHGMQEHMGAFV